jgi:hypothetical protein
MFEANFDRVSRRLSLTFAGFWSLDDAKRIRDALLGELQAAASGGLPFTVLDDLTNFGVQTPEVCEITQQFALMYGDFPISRNAMIIPGALARLQVSRTLRHLENCEVFPDFPSADAWLSEVEGK